MLTLMNHIPNKYFVQGDEASRLFLFNEIADATESHGLCAYR